MSSSWTTELHTGKIFYTEWYQFFFFKVNKIRMVKFMKLKWNKNIYIVKNVWEFDMEFSMYAFMCILN